MFIEKIVAKIITSEYFQEYEHAEIIAFAVKLLPGHHRTIEEASAVNQNITSHPHKQDPRVAPSLSQLRHIQGSGPGCIVVELNDKNVQGKELHQSRETQFRNIQATFQGFLLELEERYRSVHPLYRIVE